MAFQLYYLEFSVAFLTTGFIFGFLGDSVPGGEEYGFTDSYLEEISGGRELTCYFWAILGGVIWNVANIILCKGISLLGNAIGFPLCVGLGMVTGVLSAYIQEPKSDLAFLVPGVVLALLGASTLGFVTYRKESELASLSTAHTDAGGEGNVSKKAMQVSTGANLARKLLVCVAGGVLRGLMNIGIGKATGPACGLSPYANQTYFSIGVFLSSLGMLPLITALPIEGGKGTHLLPVLRTASSVSTKNHLLAALGGFIHCSGFYCFNLGNRPLSLTVAYCIGQSAPLVAILWGTFFFREFAGTSRRVWGLVPLVCLLFSTAISLIALAG
ncbi:unnamed protein product [Symbiodinium natans]|uniref:Uncharacterized protein n=1 Tax=Symbiodinium natans TaxID=878477 RepID=A0A812TJI0_9DINO|nr:unnamed protein product [Symbiodinium natans]